MNPQFLMDGLIAGSIIGLGAVGVTLTYSILRFFQFRPWRAFVLGPYLALAVSARSAISPRSHRADWPLLLRLVAAFGVASRNRFGRAAGAGGGHYAVFPVSAAAAAP